MSSSYPGGLDSYTTHSNGQTIDASHVNNLQDAVTAIETTLGVNPGTQYREDFLTSAVTGTRSVTTAAVPAPYTLEVFKNGAKLQPGVGYTWTAGTTAVGALAATAGDVYAIRYATSTASPGASTWDELGTGAPDSISGLVGWWQATDLTYSDGATVSAWPDKVAARAMEAVNGTPVMKTGLTGAASGKAVDFSSGSYTLPVGVFTGMTAASAVGVVKANGGGDSSGPWRFAAGDNTYWTYGGAGGTGQGYDGSFTNTRYVTAGTLADVGLDTRTAFHRLSVTHAGDSAAWNAYINNANVITQGSAPFSAPGIRSLGSGGGGFYTGRVAELIIYSRALTSTERGDLDTWLTARHA